MSDDYASMIKDELGGPADIMGISTGGSIAQYFAADHPDLVCRLVLAATGYRLSEEGKALMRQVGDLARQGKWRAVYTTEMAGVYAYGIKKHLLYMLTWLFGKLLVGTPDIPSDILVTIEAEDKHDFKERLGDIKAPTLVIGGKEDYFYPIRELAAAIPGAKSILYEGLGHNVVVNKRLVKDVLVFLAESTDDIV
jgi:pimeloyl-ACP methyl ester carboxylesterase